MYRWVKQHRVRRRTAPRRARCLLSFSIQRRRSAGPFETVAEWVNHRPDRVRESMRRLQRTSVICLLATTTNVSAPSTRRSTSSSDQDSSYSRVVSLSGSSAGARTTSKVFVAPTDRAFIWPLRLPVAFTCVTTNARTFAPRSFAAPRSPKTIYVACCMVRPATLLGSTAVIRRHQSTGLSRSSSRRVFMVTMRPSRSRYYRSPARRGR